MKLTHSLGLTPAAVLVAAGLVATPAQASTEPLSTEAVEALAVASCQLDPLAPLTAEEMGPVVVGSVDVEVVPGEITAHVVRAEVLTSAGDVQQCTFGVLHRDAQLKQVQHLGTAALSLVDSQSGASYGVDTEISLGNMGKSSPVDPTTEVALGGFLTPLENAGDDPTYTISLARKSLQVVQVAAGRGKHAAARLLKKQTKAADQLLRKQTRAAHGKHADKALAAAQKAHDKRVAAAQAQYDRATAPKTVTRPVSVSYSVSGQVPVAG